MLKKVLFLPKCALFLPTCAFFFLENHSTRPARGDTNVCLHQNGLKYNVTCVHRISEDDTYVHVFCYQHNGQTL